ncbi:MAG: hypothetical protein ACR2PL_19295 [Dehalococcoidia bacterium]
MTDRADPLSALAVAEPCRRCQEEIARYRRDQPFDDRYCFDLIRRAIVERDDDCWVELHVVYHEQVSAWCRRASAGPPLELEELVSLTWQKFWLNYTAAKLAIAGSSAGVLKYIKLCAYSVTADAARARSSLLSLDEAAIDRPDKDPTPADRHADQTIRAEFWELINLHLRNQRERVLMHLLYEIGLKSAQVQALRPDLFPDAGDIYRLHRNILDRLRRSHELQAWQAGMRD